MKREKKMSIFPTNSTHKKVQTPTEHKTHTHTQSRHAHWSECKSIIAKDLATKTKITTPKIFVTNDVFFFCFVLCIGRISSIVVVASFCPRRQHRCSPSSSSLTFFAVDAHFLASLSFFDFANLCTDCTFYVFVIFFYMRRLQFWRSFYLSPVAAAAARWLAGPWKIIAKLNIFRQKCKIFLRISAKTSVAANRRVWPLVSRSLSLLVFIRKEIVAECFSVK